MLTSTLVNCVCDRKLAKAQISSKIRRWAPCTKVQPLEERNTSILKRLQEANKRASKKLARVRPCEQLFCTSDKFKWCCDKKMPKSLRSVLDHFVISRASTPSWTSNADTGENGHNELKMSVVNVTLAVVKSNFTTGRVSGHPSWWHYESVWWNDFDVL